MGHELGANSKLVRKSHLVFLVLWLDLCASASGTLGQEWPKGRGGRLLGGMTLGQLGWASVFQEDINHPRLFLAAKSGTLMKTGGSTAARVCGGCQAVRALGSDGRFPSFTQNPSRCIRRLGRTS